MNILWTRKVALMQHNEINVFVLMCGIWGIALNKCKISTSTTYWLSGLVVRVSALILGDRPGFDSRLGHEDSKNGIQCLTGLHKSL